MTHAGFIPALAVLIFGSASAGREFKFVEVLLLYRCSDRALGHPIHLGPRAAVPIDQRLLTQSPWNSSTT